MDDLNKQSRRLWCAFAAGQGLAFAIASHTYGRDVSIHVLTFIVCGFFALVDL